MVREKHINTALDELSEVMEKYADEIQYYETWGFKDLKSSIKSLFSASLKIDWQQFYISTTTIRRVLEHYSTDDAFEKEVKLSARQLLELVNQYAKDVMCRKEMKYAQIMNKHLPATSLMID